MQALLDDLAAEMADGRSESVALVVGRVLGKPNEARKNMYAAVESVPSARRQAARERVGTPRGCLPLRACSR